MDLVFKPFEYTEEDLNEICKKYQKLLRCEDWHVEVKLVHQYELGEDIQGKCDPAISIYRALIRLPIPETFTPSLVVKECNNRLTLIHELLHLVYCALQPSPNNEDLINLMFENATDRVAEAIYLLTKDDHRYMCERERDLEMAKQEFAKERMKEAGIPADDAPGLSPGVLPHATQYIIATNALRDYHDWVENQNADAIKVLNNISEAQAAKTEEEQEAEKNMGFKGANKNHES